MHSFAFKAAISLSDLPNSWITDATKVSNDSLAASYAFLLASNQALLLCLFRSLRNLSVDVSSILQDKKGYISLKGYWHWVMTFRVSNRPGKRSCLFDSRPVFTAFNTVKGHFAYAIFISQLPDGNVPVLAAQYFLYSLYLVGIELQSNGAGCLHFLVGDLRGAVLL